MNKQNILQEGTHSVSEMLDNIAVFNKELQLWKLQSSNVMHFQILRTENPIAARNMQNSASSIRIQLPFSKHAQVWGHIFSY
jgi:hypothetical protein